MVNIGKFQSFNRMKNVWFIMQSLITSIYNGQALILEGLRSPVYALRTT